MNTFKPIPLPLNGRSTTPNSRYFRNDAKTDPSTQPDSDLLKSIRSALRGSRIDSNNSINSLTFLTTESSVEEEELSWDNFTVLLSSGGVTRKKWSFKQEEQPVQWACMGWFEQPSTLAHTSSTRSAHYTSSDPQDESELPDPKQRPTFGPFTRAEREKRPENDKATTRFRAVFVFLRSLGKIFFLNGLEYTFYLPFIVRRAWPLAPHGIIIQRLLEPGELEEAAISKDEPLPTIFSMVDPFAEASAVGLTPAVKNGRPTALDEHDISKPIASIPAEEHLVWVSSRVADVVEQMAITVNLEKNVLSVWRYIYVNPKDSPQRSHKTSPTATARPSHAQGHSKHPRRSLSLSGTHPLSPRASHAPQFVPTIPEQPPFASLPGMPPTLNTAVPMAAIVPGAVPNAPTISAPRPAPKGRRNSLGQHDVAGGGTVGGRIEGSMLNVDPVDSARMRPAYWMERLYSEEIVAADVANCRDITAGVFDNRWDGAMERAFLAVCLPRSESLLIMPLIKREHETLGIEPCMRLSATSVAPIKATRPTVLDLLVLKADGSLGLLTHGLSELPLTLVSPHADTAPIPSEMLLLKDPLETSVTLCFKNNKATRISLNLAPTFHLTRQCLHMFAMVLPPETSFQFHYLFLLRWSDKGFVNNSASFDALQEAIYGILGLDDEPKHQPASSAWDMLGKSRSFARFADDPALRKLALPSPPPAEKITQIACAPHDMHVNFLNGLHHVAQDLLLSINDHEDLKRLVPVICKLAVDIRPEWADYWKRLFPDAMGAWPAPSSAVIAHLDDRLAVSPPDIYATLYGRINNPEWDAPDTPTFQLIYPSGTRPSFAYGSVDPLSRTHHLNAIYRSLARGKDDGTTRKRAEAALRLMATSGAPQDTIMEHLPFGLALPLREAARTCQLSPAGDWPVEAYRIIGREDLAEGMSNPPDPLASREYGSIKDFLRPTFSRKSINGLVEHVRRAVGGEVMPVSGVELEQEDFTEVRFGQDRRLEEVARMLTSSSIPTVRMPDRPDLSEPDLVREYQAQVIRLAERTLSLPLGRAVFTFGSVQVVTREAYTIPKMEYSFRVQPQNVLVTPETGKLHTDSCAWGEFHNGVAAGLRISPTARGVESSWIKFNRPSELTPEHAGFLFALGLTGHLREMLTWHTFAYLTPKHDLTSIAILLGLAAANAGSSNRHVTKLLAVHTPALLPTPTVDLNVPMITQAAGLTGVGLLYMGTKHRRMAEVCLGQMCRKDLIQPDVSTEYREAYTLCAALAFGMVMLGKGSDVPADLVLLSRLRVLVHGEGHSLTGIKATRPSFDVNLTSPAATIALGFMYMRTERKDVADILTIPDTALTLERVPPGQLLLRTLARSLIMWDAIAPNNQWLGTHVPISIAVNVHAKHTNGNNVASTFELAYYHIIAGGCFAIGLKYAGTAREEAYNMLIRYHDMFMQLAFSPGPQFDHRIKRAALRDGLNLISIALSMVMAGTGEINVLRRLRHSYGTHNQVMRYGTFGAINAALGLLFLGGGRYTLGTSDAAIASMVTAFFPRFAQVSSDNRSYLQALRHLWVLAVEPRCLIARDVDTKEVVYLPVKIKARDDGEVGTAQLIAPTLIPDVDRLMSIRIDTPRYWPFYIDVANSPHHKESLIRNQTLYVKRRTAFLSYLEDPKGSRSLFVRSGSTGDVASLDFPKLKTSHNHPATDLHHFISSHSNDVLFLTFADRFCRDAGDDKDEKLFHLYCHAALMDSILQDKSRIMQYYLTLYRYRRIPLQSSSFGLAQQDLRFAFEFYGKIFERRFSGRAENNPRPALMRESALSAALYDMDQQLEVIRLRPSFLPMLRDYAQGAGVSDFANDPSLRNISRALAWYLLRNSVPVSSLLVILKALAYSSHSRCLQAPPPHGTQDLPVLKAGIKEVLHVTGSQLTPSIGGGWSISSVEAIVSTWDAQGDDEPFR